jgi:hypothetical protein
MLHDRQPVVLRASDQPRRLVHVRARLDRDRILGHQVAGERGRRLAQPALEVAERLEEHEPAEQLEVVRQVQVRVLAGHD